VQINGSGFGTVQGTVKFNATYAASIVSWSDTQIVVTVPAQAFTGPIQVTAGGVNSNPTVYFNVPGPHIVSLSPTSGGIGTQVTVSGAGFQATKGANSSISFSGIVGTVVSWSDTQIVANVPAAAKTGAVSVVVNGVASNPDKVFTLPNPIISGLSPSAGPVGTVVQINGSGFGASQGTSTIQFKSSNGSVNATVSTWSDSTITATVPTTAVSGPLLVTVGGTVSSGNVNFSVPPPQVSGVNPASGVIGTQVTISGSGFQATKGSSTIAINGVTATTTSWNDTQIVATIPSSATSGPVSVAVNGITSNQEVVFTVPNPVVTSASPTSGPVGTQVTIRGTGFGSTQGTSTLKFSGTAASITSWSDAQIVATVASGSTGGYIQVTVAGVNSPSTVYFTIPLPQITSVSPSSGAPLSSVTVTGTGFRATQNSGNPNMNITFNGVGATVTSWSDTQIVATVPATATTGPLTVNGYAGSSNTNVVFSLANPVVTAITPSSGPVGSQVQINGSGFGATQGSGTAKFNGVGNVPVSATVTAWSDTQITVTLPTTATSGGVSVTSGGVTSNNNLNFTVPKPQITSITPTSGVVGTQVTINGSGFHATQGSSTIAFSTGASLTVSSWSDTQIVATVPVAFGTTRVIATVNQISSNDDVEFTMPNPIVQSIAPLGGSTGTQVQISGSGFGATQGSSTVSFNFTNASIVNWSDTLITATVPTGATLGGVRVTVGGDTAVTIPTFTVSTLYVQKVSPQAGPVGSQVTINGNGFGASQGTNSISFNNVTATAISSWSDTQIVASIPSGASTGGVKVTVGSTPSNTNTIFTVGGVLVTGVSPASGLPGTQFQVSGSGFGSSQGSSSLTVNGLAATVSSWTSSLITATVPASGSSGAVKATVNGIASNLTTTFTVLAPVITGLSPSSGTPGTQIQISGSGFGATQGSSIFSFSGTTGSVVSWSDTSITVTVPSTAASGRVWVAQGSVFSNTNLNFTIPDPKIISVSPTSGVIGTQVTINGSGFRATKGASTSVLFNGTPATVVSWSDTQIVANVVAPAKTGPVSISGSIVSNQDVLFTMPNPIVTSLAPTSGPIGTQIQINGSGFGATQGASTLTVQGVAASVTNWSDTAITATVPTTAASGPVAVNIGGVSSNANINFNIPAPHVTSVTPNRGISGTQITVTGTGFQATQGSNALQVSINSSPGFGNASIVSWSDTQIVATMPSNAVTGPVLVKVNTVASNQDVGFSMTNPRVTALVPTNGPVGTQVQINGSGFGDTQGSSTIQIAGNVASVSSWSDSQITATVPAASRSGGIAVFVAGIMSNNNINFTVAGPRITGISPSAGTVGSTVTITGSGFQANRGTGIVSFFNNASPNSFVSWSDTQIVVAVPSGATSGAVTVFANNGAGSNQDQTFTMPNPIVSSLSPASGPTGTQVQVNGVGFGGSQNGNLITFEGVPATVVSWSDTQIVANVPSTAVSGAVQVTEGGVAGNSTVFFNVPAPTITSIAPAAGGSGNPITITGTGFQAAQGSNSYVTFSTGGSAGIKSWSDTQVVAVVPTQTTTGFVNVSVNSTPSNYVDYAIPAQSISSLTPNTGPVGTSVTVAGTGFGSSQGTSTLTFNGQTATITSWSNTQIVGTVPVTAPTGPAVVALSGVNSNAVTFTVPPPHIGGLQPNGGDPGTSVTINGTGFQANQRNSTVSFNGTPATVTAWSDLQIAVNVPSGATTGPVLINVNSVASQNDAHSQFEVPHPVIASITPPSAPANGTITISGSGFGATESYSPDGVQLIYTGFINFNGVQVLAQSWTDTSLVVTVPSNASSGSVAITKYDATSNSMPFSVEGAPTVTALAPALGPVGGSVVITGTGFGASQSTSTIDFSGVLASVTNWSDTQITATVPPGSETGPVTVTVAGVAGGTQDFTINGSIQVTDSLGNTTNYVSTMTGGAWYPTFTQGGGCSSCNIRGSLNRQLDSAGNVLSNTDELQRKTFFAYDADGNVTAETQYLDPNTPVVKSYTYNSFGEPLTVTDPLGAGHTTTNAYDANGNLTSITSPSPDGIAAPSVTQFFYDTKGQITQITDPLGNNTWITYFPTGLIHTIKDQQQNVTTYAYDLRGNRTSVIDAANNPTTFDYDGGNRLTKITYVDQTHVDFGYDSRGRRTVVTDQNGNATHYNYDDADRLTSITDAVNNQTSYGYDTESNLASITDANKHTTYFSYDAFGRLTQTQFPSLLIESYVYDAVGNLIHKTDRKNQTIDYVYDALNRLTHKGYPDSTGVDYVYDLVGKIKQGSDPTGTYGFAYDNMGRLIGTTTSYSFLPGNTYTNAYTYDAASNRTGFTASDGSTTSYGYDTLNRLSTLTDSLTGQFGFGYDNLSRRTSLTRPNGVNTSYTYDSLSRLLGVLHQNGTNTLDGAGYTYDPAGSRASKTNYLNNITENYTYDPLYQLTQVTQGATTTESYSYDAVGNRLSSQGMSPYAYNSSNQLTSTLAATLTYDGNGNMLTKVDATGTTSYGWDFENRLTSVALPGSGGTVTFKYDPLGRRIQKASAISTTNYIYDKNNNLAETDSAGTLLAHYAQSGGIDEPLAAVRSGNIGYYEQDGLGSVTSLTSATGSLGNTYTYDTFGNITTSAGAFVNPFQYTGRDTDSETGLLYYRARYYDSQIGRFFREDPKKDVIRGMNFYSYVLNNPTNYADPSGKTPWEWLDQLLKLIGLAKDTKDKTDKVVDWSLCGIYYVDCIKQATGIKVDMEMALSKDPGVYATEVATLAQQTGSNSMSQLNLNMCMKGNEECKKALECSEKGVTNPLPFPL
jgi:RHS repeat-associated protein